MFSDAVFDQHKIFLEILKTIGHNFSPANSHQCFMIVKAGRKAKGAFPGEVCLGTLNRFPKITATAHPSPLKLGA